MYLIEPLVFLAATLIIGGLGLEYRSVLFSSIATVVPLWELGQVASTGYSNLIIGTAYDPNTATFHSLVAANPDWLLLVLSMGVIINAVVTMEISFGKKKKGKSS